MHYTYTVLFDPAVSFDKPSSVSSRVGALSLATQPTHGKARDPGVVHYQASPHHKSNKTNAEFSIPFADTEVNKAEEVTPHLVPEEVGIEGHCIAKPC